MSEFREPPPKSVPPQPKPDKTPPPKEDSKTRTIAQGLPLSEQEQALSPTGVRAEQSGPNVAVGAIARDSKDVGNSERARTEQVDWAGAQAPADDEGSKCVTNAQFEQYKLEQQARLDAINAFRLADKFEGFAYSSQILAVANVRAEAERGDTPSLLQNLLSGLLDTVLMAGLGGIMGKVAATMVSRASEVINKSQLPKAAMTTALDNAKAFADGIKDGGKELAKSTAIDFLKALSSRAPSTAGYFESLAAGLDAAGQLAIRRGQALQERVFKGPCPDVVAASLVASASEGAQSAQAEQYAVTLDGWTSYLARADQGVTDRGATDLSDDFGDGADAGLLYLHLQLDRPGAQPDLLDAEIEGLSDHLVSRLAERKVGDLHVPMVVEGELPFPYTRYPNCDVDATRNEKGEVWVETDEFGSLLWLADRAGSNNGGDTAEEREALKDTARDGARGLFDDMKDLSLKGKLDD